MSGSQMGLDPKKGEKTKSRTKVLDKIKGKDGSKGGVPFGNAKKGEEGRVGKGRFNREFAMEQERRMSGMSEKEFNRHKTKNGFKSGDRDQKKGGFQGGKGFKGG